MTAGGGDRPAPGARPSRPGRRALFSDPAGPEATGATDPAPGLPEGRRALFSAPAIPSTGSDDPAARRHVPGRTTAVVHCRTCRTATTVPLVALLGALVPSLWLPTRPWPRLMRCPACRHVAWCRIDWPRLV